MQDKVFPIGSQVRIGDSDAMIAGYDLRRVENKAVPCYVVLPYPKGYARKSDVRVAPMRDVQLLQLGYETPISKPITEYFEKMLEITEKFTADEVFDNLEKFAQWLKLEVSDEL